MQTEVESSRWLAYVAYVDDIVTVGLLHTVGCRYVIGNGIYISLGNLIVIYSLAYIADNMDPYSSPPPLFEARLELQEPNLIFVPPLDDTSNSSDPNCPRGYPVIVKNLIDQVVKMATLIPRISSQGKDAPHYEVRN